MNEVFKNLKSLLTYSEPKNPENGFELLEEPNESNDYGSNQQKDSQNSKKNEDSKQNENKEKKKTTPVTVQEWNDSRKNEKDNKTKADSKLVSSELNVNLEILKQKFVVPKNKDVIIREFKIARKIKAFLIFVNGMIDNKTVNRDVLPPLMADEKFEGIGDTCPIDYIIESVLSINSVTKENDFEKLALEVLSGLTALFIDGCDQCILIETRGFEKRDISKPVTENVVMGSQEGFTENLRTNVTLLRRIVKNEHLVTEMMPVGKTNNATCAILYLDGIANPKVVAELKRRVQNVGADYIEGCAMLEQFIEDSPFALFPQIMTTERPDRAASFIMDGLVVFMDGGTPFVKAVPMTFFQLFHTSEDFLLRWQYGTFLRLVRLLGLFVATLLPALYVALTLYHQEMTPTELLTSIIRTKETVPFPTIVEVLMLEVAFELIREGGARVPGVIGQTLGIIGALILGQAAVAAGLVSPILIIIVSVTGLGSFTIPNYSLALSVRIVRFAFMFFGAIAGFYGISAAVVILFGFLCSMKSFGVPFLSPVAPKLTTNPDLIIRQPIWKQERRPDFANPLNRIRQKNTSRGWTKRKGEDSEK